MTLEDVLAQLDRAIEVSESEGSDPEYVRALKDFRDLLTQPYKQDPRKGPFKHGAGG